MEESENDDEGHKIICARGVVAVTVTDQATKVTQEDELDMAQCLYLRQSERAAAITQARNEKA